MRTLLTKGEAAELLGLTKSQIRFYEKKGLLKPQIDDNGYSLYNFEELETLEMIILLKDLNTPIKEMKKIIDEEENYDYEFFLKRSYNNIANDINKLNEKKLLIENKLKLYNQDKLNTFKIEEIDERVVYMLDNKDNIESVKGIYDLLKSHNKDYLDYSNEYCRIEKVDSVIKGFLNANGDIIVANADTYTLEKNKYFSYFMNYKYEDDYQLYVNKFKEEAKRRGLLLDDELIFIDHFNRKFYDKDRVVASIQAKIIERKTND